MEFPNTHESSSLSLLASPSGPCGSVAITWALVGGEHSETHPFDSLHQLCHGILVQGLNLGDHSLIRWSDSTDCDAEAADLNEASLSLRGLGIAGNGIEIRFVKIRNRECGCIWRIKWV